LRANDQPRCGAAPGVLRFGHRALGRARLPGTAGRGVRAVGTRIDRPRGLPCLRVRECVARLRHQPRLLPARVVRRWSEHAMTERGRAVGLDPRAEPREDEPETPTYSVGGPIAGKVVGLRLDEVWRSYIAVVDEWE